MTTADDTVKDEAAIRALVDAFVKAIRAKDVEGVMFAFAPDVVSFDLGPPLRHGREDFRGRWQALFEGHGPPLDYDVSDLNIAVGGDVAFSHSLNRTSATPERWVRWTACYRRIDGWWRIVHEHVSAPVDVRAGTAVLDLVP
ncbi:YybH family protein [Asticcacaulis solisilvae]|uniref:YybH family protein n=1 Tax=Asticcacaulis solisilvae TaxID=1217274 RepID=UPI003FD78FCB